MRLIDRIALNRVVKLLLDFILSVLKIFSKEKNGKNPDKPVSPKRRKRPVKDLVDNILPWRKNE